MPRHAAEDGLTLIELLVGAFILTVAIVALLDVLSRNVVLNDHTRNRSWAMSDANRVMERLREQNTGAACATPSLAPPAGFPTWDLWLASAGAGGGGKSLPVNAGVQELVWVSPDPGAGSLKPVTVTVCWRDQGRVVGECQWNGAQLQPNDTDGNGIITGPATLSTLMTCRR